MTAGYGWFINNGVEGLRKRILERKSKLDATVPGDYEKDVYLDALLIVCEGMEILAERYAAEADRLAGEEKDTRREAELRRIAENCRHVPAYPHVLSMRRCIVLFLPDMYIYGTKRCGV